MPGCVDLHKIPVDLVKRHMSGFAFDPRIAFHGGLDLDGFQAGLKNRPIKTAFP
jgi:hypothetical protein